MKTKTRRKHGLIVQAVSTGSIAEEVGIVPGDRLLSINGKDVKDVIDYRFLEGEEALLLELCKSNDEVWEIEIEKDLDEDLGIELPEMKIRQCPNKCVFCFVDQMPEGERNALYIRDEDYRFSFLFGNYITLTNLTRRDKARIFEQRMSPLYVSVHTTDQALRRELLVNPRARDILGEIQEMADHKIDMLCQIVLCPDLNDGKYLTQSIEDLVKFYPAVKALAIVPVGLTKHRKGLPGVKSVSREYARNLLDLMASIQARFLKKLGTPFISIADEWFVISGRPFPPLESYQELNQLENGVGLVPFFMETFKSVRSLTLRKRLTPLNILMVTGTSFSSYLADCFKTHPFFNMTFDVVTVINDFFGDSVTVAGLITGKDIIAAVQEKKKEREENTEIEQILLIPAVMLNDPGTHFLDETTPEEIESALGVKVYVVPSDAKGFIQFLQEIPEQIDNPSFVNSDAALQII